MIGYILFGMGLVGLVFSASREIRDMREHSSKRGCKCHLVYDTYYSFDFDPCPVHIAGV